MPADERKTASLTACVAHVLGVDASEVPGGGGVDLSQWLALRNLGLVLVDSPEDFEWPGRFLGLRRGSSAWAVFFGAPPGVVFDPVAEPDGRTEAVLDAAFVLAERNPLLAERGRGPAGVGKVELIALAEEAEDPMTVVPSVERPSRDGG
jgi:hypothetical protein